MNKVKKTPLNKKFIKFNPFYLPLTPVPYPENMVVKSDVLRRAHYLSRIAKAPVKSVFDFHD